MEPYLDVDGFYALVFFNTSRLDKWEIEAMFKLYGHVCSIREKRKLVFVRYKQFEEAKSALAGLKHILVDLAPAAPLVREGGNEEQNSGRQNMGGMPGYWPASSREDYHDVKSHRAGKSDGNTKSFSTFSGRCSKNDKLVQFFDQHKYIPNNMPRSLFDANEEPPPLFDVDDGPPPLVDLNDSTLLERSPLMDEHNRSPSTEILDPSLGQTIVIGNLPTRFSEKDTLGLIITLTGRTPVFISSFIFSKRKKLMYRFVHFSDVKFANLAVRSLNHVICHNNRLIVFELAKLCQTGMRRSKKPPFELQVYHCD